MSSGPVPRPTDFICCGIPRGVDSKASDGLSGLESGTKNQQLRKLSSDGLYLS